MISFLLNRLLAFSPNTFLRIHWLKPDTLSFVYASSLTSFTLLLLIAFLKNGRLSAIKSLVSSYTLREPTGADIG